MPQKTRALRAISFRIQLRSAISCFVAFAAVTLGACSPYTLSGRVIQGDASYIMLVKSDDPRLSVTDVSGVTGVSLRMTMDPGTLRRDVVANSVSGLEGEFELPVDRVGAGLLEMNMGVLARKTGYQSAEGFFELPGSGASSLLIVLAPGQDPAGMHEQGWSAEEDMRRFGQD